MDVKYYPDRETVKLCVSCYYARMRTDICGIYCTTGFVKDGQCKMFLDYDKSKKKSGNHNRKSNNADCMPIANTD